MTWYTGMGFDPEVPAGFQDADIEMREIEEDAATHFLGMPPEDCRIFVEVGPKIDECWYCAQAEATH